MKALLNTLRIRFRQASRKGKNTATRDVESGGEGEDGNDNFPKGGKGGGKALGGLGPHEGGKNERGGLRGMISSARSLGRRRGGAGGEDDQVTDVLLCCAVTAYQVHANH